MNSNISFIFRDFYVLSKNYFPILLRFSYIFSCRRLLALTFMLKSMIHFELISYQCELRVEVDFFFHIDFWISSTHCYKIPPPSPPLSNFRTFAESKLTIYVWVYFWTISFLLTYIAIICQY